VNILRVRPGEAKADVLKQMGNPWKDEECGFLGGSSKKCTEEFVYAHPYAPLLPEYWVISFDQNRRVIDHVYSTSP
jgi:hypothetical protein